jgi:signal transduction histidine kinase
MVQDQIDLEQSRSRLAELTSLFTLGNSLRMELPLETILEITVRRVASTFHAHEVDVFLLSRETRSLHVKASYGLSQRPPEPEVPYGEGLVGGCARAREAILVTTPDKDPRVRDFFAAHAGAGSALLVPVHVEGRCLGVVQICRAASAEPFRDEHRELARLFAENIGPVLERSVASVALRQTATASASAPIPPPEPDGAGSFQDVFVTMAAQELKSPLTSIVAYSEVLDQNDKRLTPALRTEFTGRVRSEAQRLMGLVDDVLDIVRLDLGRYLLELRVGNVNAIVRESVESARAATAARQVAIDVSLDDSIPDQHVDLTKLRQAVGHLLRNAVAFSPKQGRVAIATRLGDGEVRIEIRDAGPPVALDPAIALFELDAMSREEGDRAKHGFGFGLHLAKRYAELHGGSVGAAADPAGGSLFWICLPWSADLSPLVGEGPYAEELARS